MEEPTQTELSPEQVRDLLTAVHRYARQNQRHQRTGMGLGFRESTKARPARVKHNGRTTTRVPQPTEVPS
jgi:hypothetical protein